MRHHPPFVLLILLFIFSIPIQAATYTITDLGTLPHIVPSSYASAINASGQIVGWSSTPNGERAFLYANGVMTELGVLTSDNFGASAATGINASGQIVGWASADHFGSRAFLYANGVMTDLGPLTIVDGKSDHIEAYGINDSGQIVGAARMQPLDPNDPNWGGGSRGLAFLYANGAMTALNPLPGFGHTYAYAINANRQIVGALGYDSFRYANGVMTNLGTVSTPGFDESQATAINASGQIVGYAGTSSFGATHPFLYANGVMTDLGALGDAYHTRATGINAGGQIVGTSMKDCCDNVTTDSFLYSGGQMVNLNSLLPATSGWTQLGANAINDAGQIVGSGTINGQTHAFLMSPTALPITLSSSGPATAKPIAGTLSQQLTTLNATPPAFDDSWVEVHRHADWHTKASFSCSQSGLDPLSQPYLSANTFITGADEVTHDNCGSAFYRFTFTLPDNFAPMCLTGQANVDDQGVVFLNGNRISGAMNNPGCNPVAANGATDSCYAQQDVGKDVTDSAGLAILTWPTQDQFQTCNTSYFKTGLNELVFAIVGDASYYDPSGLEFTAQVTSGPAPSTFALTVNKAGTGSGTVGAGGNYAAGAVVTLTAIPDDGSVQLHHAGQ